MRYYSINVFCAVIIDKYAMILLCKSPNFKRMCNKSRLELYMYIDGVKQRGVSFYEKTTHFRRFYCRQTHE
jgi:hypothetical protein